MTPSTISEHRDLSARDFVLALHRPEDRVALLVRNRVRSRITQRILSAQDIASPSLIQWLTEQNEGGADIFLGINPVKNDSHGRTKEDIREIRHVYLDLDEDGPESLGAIRASGDTPAPNFVIDTSPQKNQVIWRVDGLDVEQAESLLRSLAAEFRGDTAATDVSRVLRVPGFRNHKYETPFLVRATQETDQAYRLSDFVIQEDSPDAPRHPGEGQDPPRRLKPGHRSQSEADWAYAKRALARGDDPEEVVRRIADFRAEDKHSPESYARRTVAKALAELELEPFKSK